MQRMPHCSISILVPAHLAGLLAWTEVMKRLGPLCWHLAPKAGCRYGTYQLRQCSQKDTLVVQRSLDHHMSHRVTSSRPWRQLEPTKAAWLFTQEPALARRLANERTHVDRTF